MIHPLAKLAVEKRAEGDPISDYLSKLWDSPEFRMQLVAMLGKSLGPELSPALMLWAMNPKSFGTLMRGGGSSLSSSAQGSPAGSALQALSRTPPASPKIPAALAGPGKPIGDAAPTGTGALAGAGTPPGPNVAALAAGAPSPGSIDNNVTPTDNSAAPAAGFGPWSGIGKDLASWYGAQRVLQGAGVPLANMGIGRSLATYGVTNLPAPIPSLSAAGAGTALSRIPAAQGAYTVGRSAVSGGELAYDLARNATGSDVAKAVRSNAGLLTNPLGMLAMPAKTVYDLVAGGKAPNWVQGSNENAGQISRAMESFKPSQIKQDYQGMKSWLGNKGIPGLLSAPAAGIGTAVSRVGNVGRFLSGSGDVPRNLFQYGQLGSDISGALGSSAKTKRMQQPAPAAPAAGSLPKPNTGLSSSPGPVKPSTSGAPWLRWGWGGGSE